MSSFVEICPLFLGKKISNVGILFWLLCYYVFWRKDVALHLNKLKSPSPKNVLCQVWLKLAQWFRGEDKNVKVYDNDDADDNDDGQRKNCDHKSSLEPSVQVN